MVITTLLPPAHAARINLRCTGLKDKEEWRCAKHNIICEAHKLAYGTVTAASINGFRTSLPDGTSALLLPALHSWIGDTPELHALACVLASHCPQCEQPALSTIASLSDLVNTLYPTRDPKLSEKVIEKAQGLSKTGGAKHCATTGQRLASSPL